MKKYIIKNTSKNLYFKRPGAGMTDNKKEAHLYTQEEYVIYRTKGVDELEFINYTQGPAGIAYTVPEPPKVFESSKVFEGFSTVFRQHNAEGTHCRFLHGYGISFKITFKGQLDYRNWVWDFGGMKRAKNKIDGMSPKEWMDYMFDHTVILSKDDPALRHFKKLDKKGLIQLRTLPAVGAERFAEFIFNKIGKFVEQETGGRVSVKKVKFMEHNRNAATYSK